MHRPYTIIHAYHQELDCWNLNRTQRALILAFVWCMKLRMEGTSFDKLQSPDYRAD